VANELAFHSVGEALRVYLSSTYPEALKDLYPCTFSVISTGQLASFEDPSDASVALTLFLYRVTVNEQLRNGSQPGRTPPDQAPSLPLDLHWMLTVWANSAPAEQVVFAWVLRQLGQRSLLDASVLPPADWAPGEVVQFLPQELPVEDLMRIWDAIEPSYRLSATYVARVVRLDLPATHPASVLTRRFELQTSPREVR
jgi:hypothetical protein